MDPQPSLHVSRITYMHVRVRFILTQYMGVEGVGGRVGEGGECLVRPSSTNGFSQTSQSPYLAALTPSLLQPVKFPGRKVHTYMPPIYFQYRAV